MAWQPEEEASSLQFYPHTGSRETAQEIGQAYTPLKLNPRKGLNT